jgi:hypothetical protein
MLFFYHYLTTATEHHTFPVHIISLPLSVADRVQPFEFF